MHRVLIIEDDITFTQMLEGFLSRNQYNVTIAHNIKAGSALLQQDKVDVLLLDYRLPDGTGMELLEKLKASGLHIPVVIMTSFNDIRTAVRAMRMGAYEYITKPVNPDELLMILQDALQSRETKVMAPAVPFVKGQSVSAQKLHEYISLVAPTNMSVVLQGESGTGKELAAQSIHQLSKRSAKPFVAIDCGALTPELALSELFGHRKGAFTGAMDDKKGLFEAADGGTIFLDEVGNLGYEVQVKLLRALQEREIQPVGSNRIIKVDIRVITATNDDLLISVKDGKFREDLYHRLNEFKILVPSLRERGSDLGLFIDYFIRMANKELGKEVKGLSTEVTDIFHNYDWPGNLRELKNIVRRAVLLTPGDIICRNAIPDEMFLSVDAAPGPDLKAIQAVTEKEQIIRTLEQVKYNKSKAAKLLNIDRTTLYYKMSKYGIE